MASPQKPGEKPKSPGKYRESGPEGGKISGARQVTMETDDTPLPPTQKPNRTWVKVPKKHAKKLITIKKSLYHQRGFLAHKMLSSI